MSKVKPDNQLVRFLRFNGKNVYFVSADGQWWIAIKPICEALGVNYDRQYKNLKSDPILSELISIQPIVAADYKFRDMTCLPEFFVYGWIFTIQSDSEELIQYKWKCYELLHNYFHGTITERSKHLRVRTQADIEIERLEQELENSETYRKIQELKSSIKAANRNLKQLDQEVIDSQLDLWLLQPPLDSTHPNN